MTSKQDQNKGAWLGRDAVKRLLACLAAAAVMSALWFCTFPGEFFHQQVRLLQDQFVSRDDNLEPRDDFVLLGVDANSMQMDAVAPGLLESEPTLKKMSADWPWDRSVHAAMIDRLANAGARLIVVDLLLSRAASAEGDRALADAIARHRDKVVLASAFLPTENGGNMRVVEPIDAFLGPLEDETACGFVNFWPHVRDGIVRRAHFSRTLSEVNNEGFHHPDQHRFESLAAVAGRKLGVSVPGGSRRFRLARAKGENLAQVYQPISYYSVFVPGDWEKKYGNGAFFKDKVVFIGPASPIFQDNHDTPAGKIYGVQLHMHVLTAMLENAWYRELDSEQRGYKTFLVLLGAFLACLVCWRWSRPWILILALLAGVGVWVGLESALATSCHYLIAGMASSSTFAAGMVGAVLWQAVAERAQRQQLHRHLRRSMSPDVADAIVRAPEGYYKAAEGNRRKVTVLFTDIRGFTSRSEEQDAGELVAQLNTYLGRMVDVVFRHGGTVDKFIGDAVMATWGALDEADSADQVRQSASAAREMLESLGELNAAWQEDGLQPFRIGIGIHHGEAIVGEVGSDQRTDFTVIGDAVNLASRIEGLTKAFGVDLLVSGAVSEKLGDDSGWIGIAKVRVKGRDGGVALHMPASDKPEENRAVRTLAERYASGDWNSAREQLGALGDHSRFAGVARFYAGLLGDSGTPDPGWDGLITMETK